MSTEAPPLEQAVATDTESKKSPFKPIELDLSAVLQKHSRAAHQSKIAEKAPREKEEAVQPPAEEKKEPEAKDKKEDAPKNPVKEEIKVDPPKEQVKDANPNRENFRALEQTRDEWKSKFEAAQKELEEARSKGNPDHAQKLTDYEKQLEDLRKSNEEYRVKIRRFDVTQDPEFERQYTQPVQNSMRELYELLVKGGVSKEDAQQAVTVWNDEKFSEITEGMSEIQKRRVDAAILETEWLSKERNKQIQQPENFAELRRQQEQQAQQQAVQERKKVAEEIIGSILQSSEALQADEHKHIIDSVRSDLDRAAEGKITPKEAMGYIAQARMLQLGLKGQHEALEEMQAKLVERDKKIEELEAFVKANGGSTLRSETGKVEGEEYVPLTKRLKVMA